MPSKTLLSLLVLSATSFALSSVAPNNQASHETIKPDNIHASETLSKIDVPSKDQVVPLEDRLAHILKGAGIVGGAYAIPKRSIPTPVPDLESALESTPEQDATPLILKGAGPVLPDQGTVEETFEKTTA